MKRVVVSQRVDSFPDRNERRDALDQAVSVWLIKGGFLPIPMPNRLDTTVCGVPTAIEWLQAVEPDAMLLSGGNDIGAAQERDETELDMLAYAEAKNLPVLGICRGMQMLAHRSGAALQSCTGHVGVRHRLCGEWTRDVNSFHCLALTQCPADFRVTAFSEDGGIEAIRHLDRNWEGWMWHPEREAIFEEDDLGRLRLLFGEER
jgi:gamma-glutamyl-gamma-aminobutyrate hydrolase PuuD